MTAFRLSASAILLSSLLAAQACAAQSTRIPVLVELFTSEGCSSCPPADALLARLEREQPVAGAEIIVLGEHVDYWDSLGWRDRFSSHQYTERQGQYSASFRLNDVYTPQMVVNGTAQFVGNDAQAASLAIAHASQAKTLPLALSDTKVEGKRLTSTASLKSKGASGVRGDLYAATQVRSGENGGHTLHHVGVVHSLTRIGTIEALLRGPVSFEIQAEPGRALRLVVFVQAEGTGPVLGAASTSVPAASRETVAAATGTR
jgi:hypothetical protein